MKLYRTFTIISAATLLVACQQRGERADTSASNNTSTLPPTSERSTVPDRSTTTTTSDTTTSDMGMKVKQAISADPSLGSVASGIEVTYANGTVTLKGTVNSDQEKQSAESVAQKAAGSAKIDNQLQVKSQEKSPDQPQQPDQQQPQQPQQPDQNAPQK